MSLWRLRGGCCTGALWVTRGCFQEDFRKYKSSYKVKSHFRLAGTNKQSCLVTTLGGGEARTVSRLNETKTISPLS